MGSQQQQFNKMTFFQHSKTQFKLKDMQTVLFFMLMNSPFYNFSQNGLDFDFITNILSFMKQITCTYMYLVQRLLNKRALASDLLYTLLPTRTQTESVQRCLKKTLARSRALQVYIAQRTNFTPTLS